MENSGHWHSAKITKEFYYKALEELNVKKIKLLETFLEKFWLSLQKNKKIFCYLT